MYFIIITHEFLTDSVYVLNYFLQIGKLTDVIKIWTVKNTNRVGKYVLVVSTPTQKSQLPRLLCTFYLAIGVG
jgi:hypothetical protein